MHNQAEQAPDGEQHALREFYCWDIAELPHSREVASTYLSQHAPTRCSGESYCGHSSAPGNVVIARAFMVDFVVHLALVHGW